MIGRGAGRPAVRRTLLDAGRQVACSRPRTRVGGRVRTDVVDGFRCDRGFQLLNPAYPAARRHLDLAALDLQVFGRGRRGAPGERPVVTLADPAPAPRLAARRRYAAAYVRPGELARLARWLAPALGPVPPPPGPARRGAGRSLDAAGVRGRLRREVLEAFLTGVLATIRP